MSKEAYFEKFENIVNAFSNKDKIAIVHDLDADGICSGAIAFNAIKLLRRKEPDFVITSPGSVKFRCSNFPAA